MGLFRWAFVNLRRVWIVGKRRSAGLWTVSGTMGRSAHAAISIGRSYRGALRVAGIAIAEASSADKIPAELVERGLGLVGRGLILVVVLIV